MHPLSLSLSSSWRVCLTSWDGGHVVEESFSGLSEVGETYPSPQRHYYRSLRSEDLAAGGCGETNTHLHCNIWKAGRKKYVNPWANDFFKSYLKTAV